jgi:Family of unknown function (DUF6252)
MKKLFYILLSALLVGTSCIDPSPEPNKLPRATQSGKNTFGCLVNGKVWVTSTSTDAMAFYQDGVLQISADLDGNGRDRGITMVVMGGLTQESSYDLANNPKTEAIIGWRNSSANCTYDRDKTLSGQLTITKLDQVKYIIAGVFEFTTFVSGCDTIKVTDGRFDLLYAP